jgi:Zn-dependent peptidase ImmA (M78 family)/transcriptional regulator with XRE-family HTH domain
MSTIDNISPEKLGERLRSARASARRTQEQAAAHLGVARTTLIAIEKGERRIRMAELQALATYYGSSCNSMLHVERLIPELVPQFRMTMGTDADESDALRAVRLLERLAGAFAGLAGLVGFVTSANYPATVRLARDQVAEQAEDAALALRSQLGLGLSPIPDLRAVLENELQFRVFERSLPSRVSGVYGFTPDVGPCVLLNALHPFTRRQTTLGHEAGHFMSTRDAVEVAIGDGSESDIVAERFAARFGPALLMPAPALRLRYNEILSSQGKFSPRHLIYLAHSFHVSLEAMCRRLEVLRLIKSGMWEALRRQGFGRRDVVEVMGDSATHAPAPIPSRLNLLAAEAYERGLVSEGQLASMLDLDRLSIRDLLDEFAGGQDEGVGDAQ